MGRRIAKDFYKELDAALKSYEENKPYHTKDIDWICNKIDWCWKWKNITEEQMKELAERATKVLKENKKL